MAGSVNSWREARRQNQKNIRRMQGNARVSDRAWHGMGFIIEAVVLLTFVAVCLAVFFRLFAYAESSSRSNTELSQAVVLASNTAEQFCINPDEFETYTTSDGNLQLACTVDTQERTSGVMYHANISVTSAETGEVVYTLTTSKYVSEVA